MISSITEKIHKAAVDILQIEDNAPSIYVVRNSAANAFVLPGGQIFVNTGLFSVGDNECELASVIGHEYAHYILKHSFEKIGIYQLVSVAMVAANFILTGGIGACIVILDLSNPFLNVFRDLIFTLPFSRKCELEADYIGLLLMKKAGYEPRCCLSFWSKMRSQEPGEVPTMLSTHPSSEKRIEKLRHHIENLEITDSF